MENTRIIAPSILSADFSRLSAEVEKINKSGAQWVHLDVMDGNFVPPITFGSKMVKDLRKFSSLPFDVHLMVEHPEQMAKDFIDAGADYLTFHYEIQQDSLQLLTQIRQWGAKPGISIIPATPVSQIYPLVRELDLVLIMTVNPGFGGQKLIPETLEKVIALRKYREEQGLDFLISIDGGVGLETLVDINRAGPDVLVTGSSFFHSEDPRGLVDRLS